MKDPTVHNTLPHHGVIAMVLLFLIFLGLLFLAPMSDVVTVIAPHMKQSVVRINGLKSIFNSAKVKH